MNPNVSYLRQIWNAVQDQQITGKDALIAVTTQRSLTGAAPTAPRTGHRTARSRAGSGCSGSCRPRPCAPVLPPAPLPAP